MIFIQQWKAPNNNDVQWFSYKNEKQQAILTFNYSHTKMKSTRQSWFSMILIQKWKAPNNNDFLCFSYKNEKHQTIMIFNGSHMLSLISSDFNICHRSWEISRNPGAWMFEPWRGPEIRLAAPMKTFARFQAGFLGSDDFHQIVHCFFYRFYAFLDFFQYLIKFQSYLRNYLDNSI